MNAFDKVITRIIQQDKPDSAPDPAIEDRLMYAYQLKRASGKVHRNSFIPGLSNFFTGKYLVFKITAVAAFFILTFHFQPWDTTTLNETFLCDSTKIQQPEKHVRDTILHRSYPIGDSVLLK